MVCEKAQHPQHGSGVQCRILSTLARPCVSGLLDASPSSQGLIVSDGYSDPEEAACVAPRHSICTGLWGSVAIIPGMGFVSLWVTLSLVRMGKWDESSLCLQAQGAAQSGGGCDT